MPLCSCIRHDGIREPSCSLCDAAALNVSVSQPHPAHLPPSPNPDVLLSQAFMQVMSFCWVCLYRRGVRARTSSSGPCRGSRPCCRTCWRTWQPTACPQTSSHMSAHPPRTPVSLFRSSCLHTRARIYSWSRCPVECWLLQGPCVRRDVRGCPSANNPCTPVQLLLHTCAGMETNSW